MVSTDNSEELAASIIVMSTQYLQDYMAQQPIKNPLLYTSPQELKTHPESRMISGPYNNIFWGIIYMIS
jgi:hypothetical protein